MISSLHSKEEIGAFLKRSPALHLYAIGDLDDFFFSHTVWYGLREEGGGLAELALLYLAGPTLLALTDRPVAPMRELLRGLAPILPRRLYGHLSPGLIEVLEPSYRTEFHGLHAKMQLVDPARIDRADIAGAVPLRAGDLSRIRELYSAAYPGNWFDPRMLETGQFFGLFREDKLVSIAGVHVYSPEHRVAALGNITTHPDYRGRGLGTGATAAVCRSLLKSGISHIGLNVAEDNSHAVACYRKLGFERIGSYEEHAMEWRP